MAKAQKLCCGLILNSQTNKRVPITCPKWQITNMAKKLMTIKLRHDQQQSWCMHALSPEQPDLSTDETDGNKEIHMHALTDILLCTQPNTQGLFWEQGRADIKR
jgi:hypothetical protein